MRKHILEKIPNRKFRTNSDCEVRPGGQRCAHSLVFHSPKVAGRCAVVATEYPLWRLYQPDPLTSLAKFLIESGIHLVTVAKHGVMCLANTVERQLQCLTTSPKLNTSAFGNACSRLA